MGCEPDRQRLSRQDLLAHQVGQRDLAGWNQVEITAFALLAVLHFAAALDLEEVVLELRQLPGAAQRRWADQIGCVALLVAVPGGVRVQHELREGAMQPRDGALHDDEASPRQLGRRREVQAETGTERDVVLHRERSRSRGPPAPDLDVVGFRASDRRRLVRQVRQRQQQFVEFDLDAGELGRRLLLRFVDGRHLREEMIRVLLAPLGLADLPGQRVAPGL